MLLIFHDLAILSDDMSKCEQDIRESQNAKPKFQYVSPFNDKVDHLQRVKYGVFASPNRKIWTIKNS